MQAIIQMLCLKIVHPPFSICTTKINEMFVDEANHIYIAIPMYNLIEYRNNYSDISGRLW